MEQKNKSVYMQVKPEEIKKDMCFAHLGLLWEVTHVRPAEMSKVFYSRVWLCPAGFADCKMKLDIMLADQIKWLRPNDKTNK